MREIDVLIFELSLLSNLRFVGGTSLYIQQLKDTINDIDIVVPDLSELGGYEVISMNETIYKFQGRQRAYFIHEGILVDVFIDSNTEATIQIEGRECSTVQAEINFKNKVLSLDLTQQKRMETNSEIIYLESL